MSVKVLEVGYHGSLFLIALTNDDAETRHGLPNN